MSSIVGYMKDPSQEKNTKYCNPLCKALNKGRVESVYKVLISKKDNINNKDPCGYMPLHFAIQRGCGVEVVKLLVDAGADINLKNSDGNTPLHIAFEVRNYNITELLITAGARLDIKSNEGKTALHLGVRHCSLGMAKMMLDKPESDINSKSRDGKTLLHFAAIGLNNPVIKYLISRDLDVNSKDDYGQTPLHCVAECGPYGSGPLNPSNSVGSGTGMIFDIRLSTMEFLLLNGANVYALNNEGETPLDALIKNSYDEFIRKLLKHTTTLSVTDNQESLKTTEASEDKQIDKSTEKDEWKRLENKMKDLREENKNLKEKFSNLEEKVRKLM